MGFRFAIMLITVCGLIHVAVAQRGGGGGRGGFQTMTLTTTAWSDGGMIPLRYTQAGPEISPAIQWSGAPAGTASFVLIFHDADTVSPNSTDDLLHWLMWNIPGTATGVAQSRPDGFELPDGSRQISVSGSRYRGPGASSTGPLHHYVMERSEEHTSELQSHVNLVCRLLLEKKKKKKNNKNKTKKKE